MKIITILALICCLIAAIHCSALRKWPANMEIPLEKCSKENNVDKDLAQMIISHQAQANSKDEKCMMACYMQQRGFLVDHKINWKALYYAHSALFTDETLRELIKNTFKTCEANFSYEGKDDCQIAFDAYKCA